MEPKTELCIIAALAEKNRVIGKDGKIPWPRFKADLDHFQRITSPHPVIMGRKTFESIGKPLVGRMNLIVSRSRNLESLNAEVSPYCLMYDSLEKAIAEAQRFPYLPPGDNRIFIAGGGEIYEQTIGLSDRLFLTLVEGDYEGDTYFPDYSAFSDVVKEEKYQSIKGVKYRIMELVKPS